ncbi:MAG: hypothetical protein ACYDBH_01520 [Acidobacteriaceae bacterium]
MAKKPVIEIDVDDTQFKAFHDLFIKYEESLAKMPKAWEDANAVMNAGIAAIAEQTHQIAKHLNSATHAQKQFGHATRAGENGLKKMAGYAEKMADSIFGVAKFMLKSAGWGAGLFGGALFGIDKLAQNAVSTQYTARGIGITTGQQRAFGMDFKRIAPAGLPESVFAAQRNMSDWGWLAKASGMNPEQAAAVNPAQLAEIILGRAHAYARKYQGNTVMMSQNAAAMMAYKAVGLGTQDVTRLGAMNGSQISLAESRFASDSLRLNYTNKAVRQLFTFSNELARMGKWIDTTITNKLAKLGPALTPLIRALGTDTNTLLNSILSPANLKNIKTGLNDFTAYLTSGKMENAISSFAESLSHLGKDIGALAAVLHALNPFVSKPIKKFGSYVGGQIFDATHPAHPVTHAFGVPAEKGSIAAKVSNWFSQESKPWYWGIPRNNPGNLRSWGNHPELGGFAVFNTAQGGLNAMSHQLQLYGSRGINTISKIINTYAPAKDHNNDPAYIAAVEKSTHFLPNQKLNLGNPDVLYKLLRAMIQHEQGRDPYPKQMIRRAAQPSVHVTLHNKTGADVAMSANAAGG